MGTCADLSSSGQITLGISQIPECVLRVEAELTSITDEVKGMSARSAKFAVGPAIRSTRLVQPSSECLGSWSCSVACERVLSVMKDHKSDTWR